MNFWQNRSNFYDKKALSLQMRIIYNVKHCYSIRLRFCGNALSSLIQGALEGEISICSTIKELLLLYSFKFLLFVAVVIIWHIYITRSVSKRNTTRNRNLWLYNWVIGVPKHPLKWRLFHHRYKTSLFSLLVLLWLFRFFHCF